MARRRRARSPSSRRKMRKRVSRGHVPIRSCAACGAKRPKRELIRLVMNKEGEIFTDLKMTAGGRGVYVCDSQQCKERLLRHKRLQRVFRSEHPVSSGNENASQYTKVFGGVNG